MRRRPGAILLLAASLLAPVALTACGRDAAGDGPVRVETAVSERSSGAPPAPAPVDAARAATSDLFSERELRKIFSMSPLPPLPPDPTNAVADDAGAAHFGRSLYFDARLSGNGEVACVTCHAPDFGFSDGRQRAEAIGVLDRHTPSLWNVAYNRWFFWDGRADSLWAQAVEPLENPAEHGTTRAECAQIVWREPDLRRGYEAVFGTMPDLSDASRFPRTARPAPDEPDHPHHLAWISMSEGDRAVIDRVVTNLTKAIAAYQRQLVSRDAPFDRFVAQLRAGAVPDPDTTMSRSAQRGLELFIGRANCHLCHFGPNFTDGEFHSTGVPPLGGGELHDAGRYLGVERLKTNRFNATGPYVDGRSEEAAERVRSLISSSETWGQFKTPSLRNVELSPPYMHQGQFADLDAVLRHYSTLEGAVLPGHHVEQLLVPVNLTDEEIADLREFLRALTGAPLDPALLEPPATPWLDG